MSCAKVYFGNKSEGQVHPRDVWKAANLWARNKLGKLLNYRYVQWYPLDRYVPRSEHDKTYFRQQKNRIQSLSNEARIIELLSCVWIDFVWWLDLLFHNIHWVWERSILKLQSRGSLDWNSSESLNIPIKNWNIFVSQDYKQRRFRFCPTNPFQVNRKMCGYTY